MSGQNLSALLEEPTNELEILNETTIQEIRDDLQDAFYYAMRLRQFNESINGIESKPRPVQQFLAESEFSPYDFSRSADIVSFRLQQIATLVDQFEHEGNILQAASEFTQDGELMIEQMVQAMDEIFTSSERVQYPIEQLLYELPELGNTGNLLSQVSRYEGSESQIYNEMSLVMQSLKRDFFEMIHGDDDLHPDGGDQVGRILTKAVIIMMVVAMVLYFTTLGIATALAIAGLVLTVIFPEIQSIPRSIPTSLKEWNNDWNPGVGRNAVTHSKLRSHLNGPNDDEIVVVTGSANKKNFLEENNAWGFVETFRDVDILAVYLGDPYSLVTHIGLIETVRDATDVRLARPLMNYPDASYQKKVVKLVPGSLIQLLNPIPKGNSPIGGLRYTTLGNFKNATNTDGL